VGGWLFNAENLKRVVQVFVSLREQLFGEIFFRTAFNVFMAGNDPCHLIFWALAVWISDTESGNGRE